MLNQENSSENSGTSHGRHESRVKKSSSRAGISSFFSLKHKIRGKHPPNHKRPKRGFIPEIPVLNPKFPENKERLLIYSGIVPLKLKESIHYGTAGQ